MRAWVFCAVCFLLACGTPRAEKVSPVQKVIELLNSLKTKVKGDLDAEAQAMDEYMKYCDMESKDTEFAIGTAQRDIEDVGAVVEDSTAAISKYEEEISSISSDIAMRETESAEAVEVRKTEHADFMDAERELIDTIDEMSRATVTIKKEQSFVQAGGKKGMGPSASEVSRMMNALGKVIEAEWVDAGSKRRITKFLQSQEAAGEDQYSMAASMKALQAPPQATQENYESHSGGILETITDMGEKAQQGLSEVRKKELQNQHTYDMLKMQLTDQKTLLKRKLSDATSRKSGAGEAKAKAEGEMAGMKKSLQADQEYLTSLNTECQEKQSSWEERKQSSADEVAAIEKATEILASGVKTTGAFVQESRAPYESRRKAAKREEVTGLLRDLAKKFHSYVLMTMATSAQTDPFAKVKGLIEDMVTRLQNEANEEATHKSFCDEELSKSTKTKQDKMAKMDEFTARSDKAASMIATREEKVKVLQSEIADIDAAQRESAKVRQHEKANFLTTNKEYTEAAEAVSQAIQVLKDYYEGASLLEKKADRQSQSVKKHRAHALEFGDAHHDAGGSIISILEMAEGDFTKLVAEGETQENQAVEAFRKLQKEDEMAKTVKMTEVTGLQSEVKSLEVNLVHYKDDHATASKEFDAVMGYLDKLRPECETKVMSYEERKARREAEIEGLKEALAIIEGEGIAVSFLERKA